MRDTIYRDEAIETVARIINGKAYWEDILDLKDALSALPSAETVKVAYICDGRKCDSDCSECFRTTDIEHAKDFKLMGDTYFQQPSAEAEPTVIRSRTFMPTKDFKEWAKRIRETNPNAVVIPCDAEVVSAEALQAVPTHGRLIDAEFEEQHYASMLINPTPDVTAKDKENARVILDALRMAKTVQADRPHGEWIVNTDDSCGGITLTCSECGEQFNFDGADEVLDYKEYAHFCIHCGADMRGEDE